MPIVNREGERKEKEKERKGGIGSKADMFGKDSPG